MLLHFQSQFYRLEWISMRCYKYINNDRVNFWRENKINCFPLLLIYQCGSCQVTLYSPSLPVAFLFSQRATNSCFSGSSEETNYSCLYFQGQVILREHRISHLQATCVKAVLPLFILLHANAALAVLAAHLLAITSLVLL